jgi:hypothetical protein
MAWSVMIAASPLPAGRRFRRSGSGPRPHRRQTPIVARYYPLDSGSDRARSRRHRSGAKSDLGTGLTIRRAATICPLIEAPAGKRGPGLPARDRGYAHALYHVTWPIIALG